MSATQTSSYDLRKEWLAEASDVDLIDRTFELAGEINSPDTVSDNLYAVLTEVFERWSPEQLWRNVVKENEESNVSDPRAELEDARAFMIDRVARRLAARCPIETGAS